jgi:hypothetical protein
MLKRETVMSHMWNNTTIAVAAAFDLTAKLVEVEI